MTEPPYEYRFGEVVNTTDANNQRVLGLRSPVDENECARPFILVEYCGAASGAWYYPHELEKADQPAPTETTRLVLERLKYPAGQERNEWEFVSVVESAYDLGREHMHADLMGYERAETAPLCRFGLESCDGTKCPGCAETACNCGIRPPYASATDWCPVCRKPFSTQPQGAPSGFDIAKRAAQARLPDLDAALANVSSAPQGAPLGTLELYDADPHCEHKIVEQPSGVKCKHCPGWFCW